MNNCGTHDIMANPSPPISTPQNEYAQNLPPNLFSKESKLVVEDTEPRQQLQETHRKVNHRCLHSLGPPPRPFKKARYAWEIKNYDYTLKKMCQNINSSTATSATPECRDQNIKEKAVNIDSSQCYSEESNFCVGAGQVCGPTKVMHEGKNTEMHMIGPPHQGGFVGPLMPTSYHAHYGAVMGGPNHTHATPLSHGDRLNSFHAQIPPDPDARLIRWHTRQLCRSIFDNTVNRMLENMGFSPVTERSQALHPLLVLSLSDDEEREAEEAHQRSLETQALSAALHQKGLLPATYHYDPLESATTSDYDSSEEDSELGEAGPDELPGEQQQQQQPPPQPPTLPHPSPHGMDEETYLALSPSQHPSLAHLVDKPLPYVTPTTPLALLSQKSTGPCNRRHCSPAQNLCDYHNHCDSHDTPVVDPSPYLECPGGRSKHSVVKGTEKGDLGKTPSLNTEESRSPKKNFEEERECPPHCHSVDCGGDEKEELQLQTLSPNPSGNVRIFEKNLKVDDNENCLPPPSSPRQETTLIEGTVEKRSLEGHHASSEIRLEGDVSKTCENDNNNDSYFIRNAIHMAMKQQGLGFQRA